MNMRVSDAQIDLKDERSIIGQLKAEAVQSSDEAYARKKSMLGIAKTQRNLGWASLVMTVPGLLLFILPGIFMFGLAIFSFLSASKKKTAIIRAFDRFHEETGIPAV
ncbi:hypothetical protein [Ruegeria sp. A3M17]|uniref:hypothetical protein n=1 Tax=Ruegeria sp. A3M17 TaxID=2267229 RepID=UPI000DE93EF1|nr:hypothetical protein [Ruegeria sp. A3M17]RBW60213.1 hypothetical protein DS906_07085 [Ruegeria sp. A3M17]